MNLRFIETVAWCAFYVGFAVFALKADATSPAYRAVFIDRTMADLMPDASRAYVPGTIIAGKGSSPFFTGEWYTGNAEKVLLCRWGKAKRNTIVVQPTRDLPRGSRITGTMAALVGGTLPNQTVAIEIDGIEVGWLTFAASDATLEENLHGENSKSFNAELPSPIRRGERLEIAFVVPTVSSPLLLHMSRWIEKFSVCLYEVALTAPAAP